MTRLEPAVCSTGSDKENHILLDRLTASGPNSCIRGHLKRDCSLAESAAASRFGANFEVEDEMSTARIALATGAGLKRAPSAGTRAVEGVEAGRKVFRGLRRAFMRVCDACSTQHACRHYSSERLRFRCMTWQQQPESQQPVSLDRVRACSSLPKLLSVTLYVTMCLICR